LQLQNIIENAKEEIHLQTYIFEGDATGLTIAKTLKRAANNKVKVFLLLDAYGSANLSKNFIEDLLKNGVNIRFFSPWYAKNSFYIGRRMHHKVVVADGKVSLIGGINIADKYHGIHDQIPWLDYAIRIDNSSISESLQKLCKNIYLKKRKSRNAIKSLVSYKNEDAFVKIIRNDWLKRKNEIGKAYLSAIHHAQHEIIIIGSYFLPGTKLLKALRKAVKSGVKVKIILSGVSDLPIVMRATRYLYKRLLRINIELFEWNLSVLHGKGAIIDSEWATVGSFNLNDLSYYGSIEMNVEINSKKFSQEFHHHINQIIPKCVKINLSGNKNEFSLLEKINNWISYKIVRIALGIATYMPLKRLNKFRKINF
jgi:cardiolipin synthase